MKVFSNSIEERRNSLRNGIVDGIVFTSRNKICLYILAQVLMWDLILEHTIWQWDQVFDQLQYALGKAVLHWGSQYVLVQPFIRSLAKCCYVVVFERAARWNHAGNSHAKSCTNTHNHTCTTTLKLVLVIQCLGSLVSFDHSRCVCQCHFMCVYAYSVGVCVCMHQCVCVYEISE